MIKTEHRIITRWHISHRSERMHQLSGVTWYRKHFTPRRVGKENTIPPPAIAGKSKNMAERKVTKEHFVVTCHRRCHFQSVMERRQCCPTVWADNSDDPPYPPGKPQDARTLHILEEFTRDIVG